MPAKSVMSSPVKVWHAILLLFVVALAGIVAVDGVMFYKIGNNTFLESETTRITPPELIDRSKLDRVLSEQQQKVERFNSYMIKAPAVIDPSR